VPCRALKAPRSRLIPPHASNVIEMPGSSMPSKTVLQVSPQRIGSATVNVPVVTN
jgi:hypothetical protein